MRKIPNLYITQTLLSVHFGNVEKIYYIQFSFKLNFYVRSN